jgi:DNA repair protein RadC
MLVLMLSQDLTSLPREQLLRGDPRFLREVDLLAAVLRNGRRGQNVLELAADLIETYDGVVGLAKMGAAALAGAPGVGPAKAAAVVAAFELGRREAALTVGASLRRSEDVVAVARDECGRSRRHRLLLLICDATRRVQWVVVVAEGIRLTRPMLPVAQVVQATVAHGGRGFAIARVAPDPDPAVDEHDRELVRRLDVAARRAEVTLLDAVVVGDASWRSAFSELPVASMGS